MRSMQPTPGASRARHEAPAGDLRVRERVRVAQGEEPQGHVGRRPLGLVVTTSQSLRRAPSRSPARPRATALPTAPRGSPARVASSKSTAARESSPGTAPRFHPGAPRRARPRPTRTPSPRAPHHGLVARRGGPAGRSASSTRARVSTRAAGGTPQRPRRPVVHRQPRLAVGHEPVEQEVPGRWRASTAARPAREGSGPSARARRRRARPPWPRGARRGSPPRRGPWPRRSAGGSSAAPRDGDDLRHLPRHVGHQPRQPAPGTLEHALGEHGHPLPGRLVPGQPVRAGREPLRGRVEPARAHERAQRVEPGEASGEHVSNHARATRNARASMVGAPQICS